MRARAAWVLWCGLVVLAIALAGPSTAVGGTTIGGAGDPASSAGGGPGSLESGGPSAVGTPVAVQPHVQAQEDDGTDGDPPSIEGYDEVHVEIGLGGGNETATWTVEYRYRLDADDNDTVAWDALRTGVESQPDEYVAAFEDRWTDDLERAENETDREMALSDIEVRAENQSGVQEYGFVTFTFRWSGFAHVELNRIEAGDALAGFVLDDRSRLVMTFPGEYNLTAVEPAPDDRRETAVIWNGGETEFVEGEPRVELMREEDESNATAAEPEGWSIPWWPWLTGIGFGVVLALVTLVAIAGRLSSDAGDGGSRRLSTDGSSAADSETDTEEPPPELLSNQERVVRLLEDSGGRIKQQEVVSELGWTEAKTSQVVSDLREAGTIEVFRIGRENVLALPDAGNGEAPRNGSDERA